MRLHRKSDEDFGSDERRFAPPSQNAMRSFMNTTIRLSPIEKKMAIMRENIGDVVGISHPKLAASSPSMRLLSREAWRSRHINVPMLLSWRVGDISYRPATSSEARLTVEAGLSVCAPIIDVLCMAASP